MESLRVANLHASLVPKPGAPVPAFTPALHIEVQDQRRDRSVALPPIDWRL
jgi:hypothetical protein